MDILNAVNILEELAAYLKEQCHFRIENGRIEWDCDRTRTHTKRWARAHHIKLKDLPVPSHFCDCEIIFNLSGLQIAALSICEEEEEIPEATQPGLFDV